MTLLALLVAPRLGWGRRHDGSEEVHHRVLIPTATSGSSRSLGGGGQTTEGALALLLLVPSEEFPNLVQDAGVLLFPAEPKGSLSRGSRAHVWWLVAVWMGVRSEKKETFGESFANETKRS